MKYVPHMQNETFANENEFNTHVWNFRFTNGIEIYETHEILFSYENFL